MIVATIDHYRQHTRDIKARVGFSLTRQVYWLDPGTKVCEVVVVAKVRVRNMGPECARIMGGYWVCMQGSRVTQPMYTTIYTDQTMAPFSPDRLGTRPCCTRIINGNICTQHSAHYDLSCISDHQQNSAQTGRSAHETRLVPTPTIAAAAAITTTTFNARANAIAMAISFHIRNEILEMDGV
ncbi:hypothetical protein BLOT_000055 [Blomia tropicalis]|nr:hypothetical protein BLOT_000055 [Blomia tropicalis]